MLRRTAICIGLLALAFPPLFARAGGTTTTTSTTTAASSTTATTLADCTDVPSGPTFASITCRLDVLLADVQAEGQLGKVQGQLARALQTAISRFADAETKCNASDTKHAASRVVQTGENLRKFLHRLGATGTRRKVPLAVRGPLATMAKGIRSDVIKLRSPLHCPPPA